MSWLRYFKVLVGGAILLLLCVAAWPRRCWRRAIPRRRQLEDRLRPPRWTENGSAAYFLGTDNLGRTC